MKLVYGSVDKSRTWGVRMNFSIEILGRMAARNLKSGTKIGYWIRIKELEMMVLALINEYVSRDDIVQVRLSNWCCRC